MLSAFPSIAAIERTSEIGSFVPSLEVRLVASVPLATCLRFFDKSA